MRRFEPPPSPRMHAQPCPPTRSSATHMHKLTYAPHPTPIPSQVPQPPFQPAQPYPLPHRRSRSRNRCTCRRRHSCRRCCTCRHTSRLRPVRQLPMSCPPLPLTCQLLPPHVSLCHVSRRHPGHHRHRNCRCHRVYVRRRLCARRRECRVPCSILHIFLVYRISKVKY